MELRDARTIKPEELLERRKQAVLLHQQGLKLAAIAEAVGVHRNTVGQWIAKWKEKGTIRSVCRRGRGRSLGMVITELTPKLRGWMNYFRLAEVKGIFEELDQWIRRKLRCIFWRQWKRPYTRAKRLMRRGLDQVRAWRSATNGRGPWWNAGASHMNLAFPKRYFDNSGLVSLLDQLHKLQRTT